MLIGTTPSYTITLPFEVNRIKEVFFSFSQNDIEVFCKKMKDCKLEGYKVTAKLTQEDSFLLAADVPLQASLRILTTTDDDVVGVKPFVIDDVYDSPNKEVMK